MLLENEKITMVFREVYPGLCRFLENIVGRDRLAQDLAQESFLRLCRAELGPIPHDEIRFWLYRVARNLALNELGRSRTRTKFWRRLVDFLAADEPDPERKMIADESRRIVRRLLERLPETRRSALLLREQEEMSYREIALVLDVSESKVRVDIFRARQELRKMWFEEENKSVLE
ncbi:MAG: sigma-70 family RNA polymerase sigma factor [Acidobacteria bacterium]|nr:sigma-70 family RNA polymerase sigma factor [Acidobacteriota bacterium]